MAGVANECGFYDKSHSSKQFKTTTGLTPLHGAAETKNRGGRISVQAETSPYLNYHQQPYWPVKSCDHGECRTVTCKSCDIRNSTRSHRPCCTFLFATACRTGVRKCRLELRFEVSNGLTQGPQ